MKPPTVTSFFLGSNSEAGFYSLYDQFCAGNSDRLHIIKGGPGTGKSTFMRRIGNAAEARGLDVEYILCSGDPDSLDGVYIPALHTGWADGTAPHILEPRQFGTTAVYEDLGRFCQYGELLQCRHLIATLTDEYRHCYQTAYGYLHAAASIQKSSFKQLSSESEDKLRKRARSKIKRELTFPHQENKTVKRFIKAISHTGVFVVDQTVNTLCNRLCILESDFGLEQLFFQEIQSELTAAQADYILCPDPLCPDLIHGILLPKEQLGFLSSQTPVNFQGTIRTIHLDSYLPKWDKTDLSVRKNLYQQLLHAGISHLRNAKHLHDDLELCYRPALNIQALNDYTESVIDRLF